MPLRAERSKNLLPTFAAFCFFLSAIEFLIPKPLPFLRIGLANVPVLLAIDLFSFKSFFMLVLLKTFGQALINGTLFSYVALFSLAGSLSSGLVMYLLGKIPRRSISFIGIALVGALCSNTVQLLLARFLIFGEGMRYVIVPLLFVGSISAIALGAFSNRFVRLSTWYEEIKNTDCSELAYSQSEAVPFRRLKLLSGTVLLLLAFFLPFVLVRVLVFIVAIILCLCAKVKINILSLLLTSVCIVLFNVYPPFGRLLLSYGSFYVTSGALSFGIQKMFLFESLIYISKWMLQSPVAFKSGRALLLVDSVTMLYKTIFDIISGDFSFLQDAVRMRYLKIISVFTAGSTVGLISFSHLLGYVLKRWHDIVIATIIGFITGSLGIVWPWKREIYKIQNSNILMDSKGNAIIENFERYFPDFTIMETWIAILFIILGAGLVYFIDIYSKKRKKH